MTVASFTVQVIVHATLKAGFHGEWYPLLAEPADDGWAVLHGKPYRIGMAQTRSRNQRILYVRLNGITDIEHRRYAALGIMGAALIRWAFGQSDDARAIRQSQRQTQTGSAAADDQHISRDGGRGHGLWVTP